MQAKFSPPNPPNKALPAAAHRRQMIWQVWAPLFVSIIIVLGLAFLAIAGAAVGSPQVERWASISAVLVIIPWLIIGLIIFAIIGGVAYGVFWLLERMPGWLLTAQLFMVQTALTVRRIADVVAKPVMSVNIFSAQVSALWRKLARRSP